MRAILTWHSIDLSGSPISVTPVLFGQQLAWIADAGLRVVRVAELLALPADVDAVAITFDDGFANFGTEAAPLLRERGWPATLFVVTARVGLDNRWTGTSSGLPTLPLLDWDALTALSRQGVDVENHTRTHAPLPSVADSLIADEIRGAADEIARRIGRPPDGIAYPYGACDARTLTAARAVHRWGVTTEFRALDVSDHVLQLPRLDAWYFRRRAHFAGWGSTRFSAWAWARRHARRVRAALTSRQDAR